MREVPSSQLQRNPGDVLDSAGKEPILITRFGKGRFVICDHAHYSQLWNDAMRHRGQLHDVDDATLEKARGEAGS